MAAWPQIAVPTWARHPLLRDALCAWVKHVPFSPSIWHEPQRATQLRSYYIPVSDVCLQPACLWPLTLLPLSLAFWLCVVSPSQLSGQCLTLLLAMVTQSILSSLLFSPARPLFPLHSWALRGHGSLGCSSVGTGGSGRCKFFPFMWVNSQHHIKIFITKVSIWMLIWGGSWFIVPSTGPWAEPDSDDITLWWQSGQERSALREKHWFLHLLWGWSMVGLSGQRNCCLPGRSCLRRSHSLVDAWLVGYGRV